ncbi:hypothetical protein LINPERHAP2_LOCUS27026 [Linum perenne]
MEGIKKHGNDSSSSSSSFTADLFGTKESPPPTNSGGGGAFASIFPPPSTVMKKYSSSEGTGAWQMHQHSGTQAWNSSISKHRTTMEPCHLSSSIYYGGQENYSHSSTIQSPTPHPIYKKDGGDEDPNGSSASRGNWWQGSLYY